MTISRYLNFLTGQPYYATGMAIPDYVPKGMEGMTQAMTMDRRRIKNEDKNMYSQVSVPVTNCLLGQGTMPKRPVQIIMYVCKYI